MISNQKGFTLIELMLAIALSSLFAIFTFSEKQTELDNQKAKQSGSLLAEYSMAVSKWVSANPGAANSVIPGTSWLKHTSCTGGTSAVSYLRCDFPNGDAISPIGVGKLQISNSILTTGVPPNVTTKVTTTTTPYKHNAQDNASLSGLSAISAASTITNITGSSIGGGIKISSNPLTAQISIEAGNTASTDIWLRTDGSNSMNGNIAFNSAIANTNRKIVGVSSIESLATEVLNLGPVGGATLATPAVVSVSANQALAGTLNIQNSKSNAIALQINSGNINLASGGVVATGNIQTAGFVFSNSVVSSNYYDKDDTAYYVNPNGSSRINSLVTTGRVTATELLTTSNQIEGGVCNPNGLISKTLAGRLLFCESGIWIAGGGGGLGVGQTWGDYTCCRSLGVTYTNTTSKPILVSVLGGSPGGNSNATLTVGGVVVDYYAAASTNSSLQSIVPSGQTYVVTGFNWNYTSGIPYGWKELR